MLIYQKLKYHIIIATVILYLGCVKGMAQGYIPMLKYNSEWHVTNCDMGCATDKYYTIGDTIIDGLHYRFLDQFHYLKNFFIREDTITRKVYLRLRADMPPVKDYLLYDFSMQVNDTISITNPGSPYPKYPGAFVLDSIISKPLLNFNHRFFYLHALDTVTAQTKNTIWVEGIGSLCLINTPGAPPQINGVGQLSCFFSNNINEYSQLDSISDCVAVYPLSVSELNTNSAFIVSQNFDNITITLLAKRYEIARLFIYSTQGKLELEKQHLGLSATLPIGSLSKGLLLVKIIDERGNLYSYKIFNP